MMYDEIKEFNITMYYLPGKPFNNIKDRVVIVGSEEEVELFKASFVGIDVYNKLKDECEEAKENWKDLSDRICKIDKIIKED